MTTELGKSGILSGPVNRGKLVNVPGGAARDLVDVRCADDEARVLTVTLCPPRVGSTNPETASMTGGPVDGAPFARLEWGVEGARVGRVTFSAEVDFRIGCSFQVAASYLRIAGVAQDVDPTKSALLGAFVGYGTSAPAAANAAPTRTLSFDTLAAGATSPLRTVPAFASSVMLVSRQTASNLVAEIRLFNVDGTTQIQNIEFSSSAFTRNYSLNLPAWLSPDVRSVSVTNTSGGAQLFAPRLIFGLAL